MNDIEEKIKKIQSQENVTNVFGHIQAGATLTVSEEIGAVFTVVTAVPAAIHTEQWKVTLSEGRLYAAGQKEVIIGHKLKKELGAKLGDDVVFLGATQDGAMFHAQLVGVIADHLMFNKRAFIPLAQGQYFTDMEDIVTELLVYGSHLMMRLRLPTVYVPREVSAKLR